MDEEVFAPPRSMLRKAIWGGIGRVSVGTWTLTSRFANLDNVILSPHVGSALYERRETCDGFSCFGQHSCRTKWQRSYRPHCGVRRMRIAIGGFLHESHSFAPHPTTYRDFVQPGGFPPLCHGAAC